jgi:hypothetical protein
LALVSPADPELRRGTITQPDVFVVPRNTRIAEALAWSDVELLRLVERWTPAKESPVIVRDRLTWRPAVEALEIDLAGFVSALPRRHRCSCGTCNAPAVR